MEKITAIVILTTIVLLCLYDIYVLAFHESKFTISVVFYHWYCRHPWFLFFAGFLCGHLFAPIRITVKQLIDK